MLTTKCAFRTTLSDTVTQLWAILAAPCAVLTTMWATSTTLRVMLITMWATPTTLRVMLTTMWAILTTKCAVLPTQWAVFATMWAILNLVLYSVHYTYYTCCRQSHTRFLTHRALCCLHSSFPTSVLKQKHEPALTTSPVDSPIMPLVYSLINIFGRQP